MARDQGGPCHCRLPALLHEWRAPRFLAGALTHRVHRLRPGGALLHGTKRRLPSLRDKRTGIGPSGAGSGDERLAVLDVRGAEAGAWASAATAAAAARVWNPAIATSYSVQLSTSISVAGKPAACVRARNVCAAANVLVVPKTTSNWPWSSGLGFRVHAGAEVVVAAVVVAAVVVADFVVVLVVVVDFFVPPPPPPPPVVVVVPDAVVVVSGMVDVGVVVVVPVGRETFRSASIVARRKPARLTRTSTFPAAARVRKRPTSTSYFVQLSRSIRALKPARRALACSSLAAERALVQPSTTSNRPLSARSSVHATCVLGDVAPVLATAVAAVTPPPASSASATNVIRVLFKVVFPRSTKARSAECRVGLETWLLAVRPAGSA